jgi:hypothetical protein
MNEWDRLSEMSTGTRRYLAKPEVRDMVHEAAVKIAKIELIKRRVEAHGHGRHQSRSEAFKELPSTPVPPPFNHAVELPSNDMPVRTTPPQSRGSSNPSTGYSRPYSQESSSQDKFVLSSPEAPQRASLEMPYRPSADYARYDRTQRTTSPGRSDDEEYGRPSAPPIPPKTPINDPGYPLPMNRPNVNPRLPYPDTDGPPPIVNKLRKPEFSAR